jgi:hypothetical protein
LVSFQHLFLPNLISKYAISVKPLPLISPNQIINL